MAFDFALLVLRVFLGLQMASHGSQKLFGLFGGHGPKGTGGYLEGLGFRPGQPFALAAGTGEFVGGLLLALGWLTPFGAGAVAAVTLTAVVTAHAGKGFFVTEGGYELPLLIAVTAVCIAFVGPGVFSVDNALDWNLAGWTWGVVAAALGVVGTAGALAARGLRHRAGAEA